MNIGQPRAATQLTGSGTGNAPTVTTLVNFGATPVYTVVTTVSVPWVYAGEQFICEVQPTTTAEHDPEDGIIESLIATVSNIVAGVSFDLTVYSPLKSFGHYSVESVGL